MDKILVSVDDACAMLSLSRSFFYRLVSTGRIKKIKIGRRTLFEVKTLMDFVTELSNAKN